MKKVYSYSRWSTKEQADGSSLLRQTDLARRWAANAGMEYEDAVLIIDEGISAFRGLNVRDGGLARFLLACREGAIEPGSYLLVESLDRISRMPPRKVQQIVNEIVDHDVTIVTLNDDQQYTAERLDRDPLALIVALLVSWRAHDESRTKAERVAAAWAHKRASVRANPGTYFTKRAPRWLLPNEDGSWTVDPDRSKVVRDIYAKTLKGIGEQRIADWLNARGVQPFGCGKRWHRSAISKLLNNRAVIGTLTPGRIEYFEGRRKRVLEDGVEGAFPQIISHDAWLAVRKLKAARSCGGPPKPNIVRHSLAGLAKCHLCTGPMQRVNKGSSAKSGKPKLICSTALRRSGCAYVPVDSQQIDAAIANHLPRLLEEIMQAGAGLERVHLGEWSLQKSELSCLHEFLRTNSSVSDVRGWNQALTSVFRAAVVDPVTKVVAFKWRSASCVTQPVTVFFG